MKIHDVRLHGTLNCWQVILDDYPVGDLIPVQKDADVIVDWLKYALDDIVNGDLEEESIRLQSEIDRLEDELNELHDTHDALKETIRKDLQSLSDDIDFMRDNYDSY
jgi:hypothetical protein